MNRRARKPMYGFNMAYRKLLVWGTREQVHKKKINLEAASENVARLGDFPYYIIPVPSEVSEGELDGNCQCLF
jgi:hypothetical protein